MRQRDRRHLKRRLHSLTAVQATGLGDKQKHAHKVLVGKTNLWHAHTTVKQQFQAIQCEPMDVRGEMRRFKACEKLRRKFQKVAGRQAPVLCFERWISRMRLRRDLMSMSNDRLRKAVYADNLPAKRKKGKRKKFDDVLLPSELYIDDGLLSDLERGGMSEQQRTKIAEDLLEASHQLLDKINSDPEEKCDEKVMNTIYVDRHRHTLDFRIGSCNEDEFDGRVFSVLLRYRALLGHGFQAALCEQAFDVLHEEFDVSFECFASPLNARYSQYCSLFPDVDAVFGSIGSFFTFRPKSGSFELNPPFISEVMLAAVLHIEELLNRSIHAMSFIVILPGWKDDNAWMKAKESSFTTVVWELAKEDHGYCDGAQHQRQDRYRESPYDTHVFFMQNDQGREKWKPSIGIEQRFRTAMADAVPSEFMTQRTYKSDCKRMDYKRKKKSK